MDVDEFLEHHGIKGMHWGVRQDQSSGNVGEQTPSDHAKLKKTAKIAGGVLVAAAVVAGSVYLAKHPELLQKAVDPKTKTGNIKKGKEFVESLTDEEPTSHIHVARGKYAGYRYLADGGLSDPLRELDKSGITDENLGVNNYKRYGKKLEKVAVNFRDPESRKDFAGRVIEHQVVIPEHQATGIDTFEKARDKAYDLVKNNYDKFYEDSLDKYKYSN